MIIFKLTFGVSALPTNDSVFGASIQSNGLSPKCPWREPRRLNKLKLVPTPGASLPGHGNKLSTFVSSVRALGANVHAFSANFPALSADDPVFGFKLTFVFPVLHTDTSVLDADFSVYSAYGGNLIAVNTLPASASSTSLCKTRVSHLTFLSFCHPSVSVCYGCQQSLKYQRSANTSTTLDLVVVF